MKTNVICALLLSFLLGGVNGFAQKAATKIACVGNSITYGANIANRNKNSYPAQLQAYLGSDYEVRNYGISGTTALAKGDHPYIKTRAYAESHAFQPDIVLIKLGTNDTKPQNWQYKEEFMSNYQQLIDSYKSLPSQPRIILLTPIRCFLPEGSSINAKQIATKVRYMVEELAWKNDLEVINLFNLFSDSWKSHLLPDRLHPSAIGAGEMAHRIGVYLTTDRCAEEENDSWLSQTATFNFHGYCGYTFDCEGAACKIVKPHKTASGKPWVIRARFWGHEPQTDIALLEQGFHITYCNVAGMYGSDKAIKRWDKLYEKMTKEGFHKKVVLEGMSRGGLIVYNWAAKNAKKVACIYADAPVMDFKSWPLGTGDSKGSDEDVPKLLSAYGFSNKEAALKWKKNPLNHAKKIAKAGIPCLHVVGDADEVVPVRENTAIFEKEMERLGAPITVIHKPGIGHHPHSLNNPAPIVRFILSALHRLPNECTHAVPGNEFRSGAGWTKDTEWHTINADIQATLANKKLKLLLLGNSITQGWGGTRKAVAYKPGKQVLDRILGEGAWESAGISGDRTQNLLWRIRHCDYNRCRPENIVIAIGVNNLLAGGNTPEEVTEGIIAVTKEAIRQFPGSRIILLGLFPAGKEKESDIRISCDKIHAALSKKKWTGVQYVNPTKWFVDEQGNIRDGLYSTDYIHLTSAGYDVLAKKITELMN